MNIVTAEIRRAKLRFGLLTGAVALLVFLVLLLTTLSSALVTALVGALDGLNTQGLVYAASARDNLQASRLDPATASAVAAVPGVSAVGSIASFTTTGTVDGAETEMQILGYTPDAPGTPTALSSGRLPQAANEVAVDAKGLAIGDVVSVGASETELTVVGLLRGAQFNALSTGYVLLDTYNTLLTAENPGLPFVPVNAIAFDVDAGADVATVATAIEQAVPETRGYTRAQAVSLIPGIESISQSFGILQGLTFLIAVVVIGFFFLILTVQKLRAITVLRAIGTSTARLGGALLTQIALVVVVGSAIAALLTFGAVRGLNTGLPVNVDPMLLAGVVVVVLVFALITGLFSIRRLARIDPATATGVR